MKKLLIATLFVISLPVMADDDYYDQQMQAYGYQQPSTSYSNQDPYQAIRENQAAQARNAINSFQNPTATPERVTNEAENMNNMWRYRQRNQ